MNKDFDKDMEIKTIMDDDEIVLTDICKKIEKGIKNMKKKNEFTKVDGFHFAMFVKYGESYKEMENMQMELCKMAYDFGN